MPSRLPGFYKKSVSERVETVMENTELSNQEHSSLLASSLTPEIASIMVENVIGTFALPLATAVNFICNGRDVLVPMVIEEPSVVAAVSNIAKLVRPYGGFQANCDRSIMIGQIQLTHVKHPLKAITLIEKNAQDLIHSCINLFPRLTDRGGGLRGITARHIVYDEENEQKVDMVVVHFYLDCVDAMGANMINTIAEYMAPKIEELTGEKANLRILSNYASKRIAKASCSIPIEALQTKFYSGEDVASGIVDAYRFAYADPWRAATHNKGVMNGIDAVVIATGNDWRAIEAGAHAWASRSGQYRSLTKWKIDGGKLNGSISVPMQIGTVGGSIRSHPQVQSCLQILGNPRAQELAGIIAMVGLAQNLGALKALATEGIQKGHMRMHARSIASRVGAQGDELIVVVDKMCAKKDFSTTFAEKALHQIRNDK
jgi:hydroxymethylglutaryl-CoA reductase